MAFNDNFEQTLKDFFFVNHPRKSKLIPQMVKEFAGSEREVMMLLCKKYNVSTNTIEGLSASTPAPTPLADNTAEASSYDSNTIIEEEIAEKKEPVVEALEENSNDTKEKKK